MKSMKLLEMILNCKLKVSFWRYC